MTRVSIGLALSHELVSKRLLQILFDQADYCQGACVERNFHSIPTEVQCDCMLSVVACACKIEVVVRQVEIGPFVQNKISRNTTPGNESLKAIRNDAAERS